VKAFFFPRQQLTLSLTRLCEAAHTTGCCGECVFPFSSPFLFFDLPLSLSSSFSLTHFPTHTQTQNDWVQEQRRKTVIQEVHQNFTEKPQSIEFAQQQGRQEGTQSGRSSLLPRVWSSELVCEVHGEVRPPSFMHNIQVHSSFYIYLRRALPASYAGRQAELFIHSDQKKAITSNRRRASRQRTNERADRPSIDRSTSVETNK